MVQSYSLAPSRTEFEPLETTDIRRLHFYERGMSIPLAADGFWQVYRGVVQISEILANGDEVLLGWSHPSTFFGLELTLIQLETYQAKSLSDVYLRWYSIAEVHHNPKLMLLVFNQTLKRLRQTEALLAIAGLKRVDERLEGLLKLLAQEMGEPIADGIRLSVRLTHQMLANTISTTRVTVTRLLGDLQTEGRISFDCDRHLVIHLTK
ncbi:MAG: Crp/Fnr family transcriptional regulator [Microcystaceae cyanobacterium]